MRHYQAMLLDRGVKSIKDIYVPDGVKVVGLIREAFPAAEILWIIIYPQPR